MKTLQQASLLILSMMAFCGLQLLNAQSGPAAPLLIADESSLSPHTAPAAPAAGVDSPGVFKFPPSEPIVLTAPGTKLFTGTFKSPFSKGGSATIFNYSSFTDERWKIVHPGTPTNLPAYSSEMLNLSDMLHGAHTFFGGSLGHSVAQGVAYDFEPTFGFFALWPGHNGYNFKAPTGDTFRTISTLKNTQQTIFGLAAEIDNQSLYGHKATTQEGLRAYLLWVWKPKSNVKPVSSLTIEGSQYDCHNLNSIPTSDPNLRKVSAACTLILNGSQKQPIARNTFTVNFKGFLPAAKTIEYGHASALAQYDLQITQTISMTLAVQDSYYSTVSSVGNHNVVYPSLSFNFAHRGQIPGSSSKENKSGNRI
jgi:hypothetical protein